MEKPEVAQKTKVQLEIKILRITKSVHGKDRKRTKAQLRLHWLQPF